MLVHSIKLGMRNGTTSYEAVPLPSSHLHIMPKKLLKEME
ncbi:hypothetical protein HMPREF1869_00983 [Bacteroidales bacterium KA00251]|nr:hypothetical protein HMPREF1869_00983 [Bacteroidales bacterium KA00251]